MHRKIAHLKRMLNPQHIVYIGGKKLIQQGIENCLKAGYQGDIYAVHQKEEEIAGFTCYNKLSELPIVPDAAFIAIRGDKAVHVIEELKQMGVAGGVCYAAGFSEIGNHQLHHDLIEAAGDMALVGPNCYGVINYLDRVPLWPDNFGSGPTETGAAIISQSGNLSLNITMNNRSLPLAYMMSVGNQAVLDIADYILAMCDDPRVSAIGVHIEGLTDIEKFSKAARTALDKGIPIVAFKTGVSEKGSVLTMSHTSSLAGSDDLYQALFDRLNISRVHSLSAFLETLKLFAVVGTMEGRNLGVLTCSGGESTIVADIAEQNQFNLPNLNLKQQEELKTLLTKFEHISNPLDYNTSIWGDEERLFTCFSTFMQGAIDTSLLILDYLHEDSSDIDDWHAAVNAFIKAHEKVASQAIMISVLPEGMPIAFREKLIASGIAPLQGMEEAFTAISAVTTYNEKKRRNHFVMTNFLKPNPYFQTGESVVLDEWQGKQVLQEYGLKVPWGKVVSLDEETIVDANMTGPFVVKAVSSNIAHKSDLGAVQLNVQSEEEIRQVMWQMHHSLVENMGEDVKFLVEEMIPDAVAELNIGVKRDSQFGLALIISMGGELVNLMNDSVPILLPASHDEILKALHSLKGIALLKGFRGRPKGDIEAVVKAAKAVARYAEAYQDHLLEMDINPLLVLPEDEGVVAVDAFIRVIANKAGNAV